MCGIAGIYNSKDKSNAYSATALMCARMKHRGPDAEGVWQNEHVTLGHRRLSIIDTSDAGNQPFHSEDGLLTIVFNGEIYNYIELRNELSAYFQFKTHSDTEVMLAAYRKWGIECVHRFYGMFAFGLWDEQLRTLYIVRDRLGVKPVYYLQQNGELLFSSEIRALLATGKVKKKISRSALQEYLSYQTVHAPDTIVDGVKMLLPGQMLICHSGEIKIKQYWSLPENAVKEINHEPQEVKKHVHDLLRSSVEIRMRADVPFGAFLSGGIDSSAIVGLMSELSAHRVKTFAVTFHEKLFDESPYSGIIAKKFNTDHTEIRLHAKDFMLLMPDALRDMDHPSGDGPNTYVVSKVTREQGVKMALSGLGGDEVFAGYDVFRRMKSAESNSWMNLVPAFLRTAAGKILLAVNPSVATEKMAMALSAKKLDFEHLYPLTRQLFSRGQIGKLLRQNGKNQNAIREVVGSIAQLKTPILSKVSMAEMSTYMQNVLLRDADQMSMAHALEVRVPFLDHRLVEYVLGISDAIKYPHTPKQLLVDSLGDLLPREIIDRPKMGFTFPWAYWMRNELKAFCEENLNALQQIEELNCNEVKILWQRFLSNDKRITWSRIWPMVTLGHWVKQHDVH